MSGMVDPWGLEQPPADTGPVAALPPRLARLARVQATGVALTDEDPYAQDFPAAAELPEVKMLVRSGWRPLESAPLYCLLPAAWPVEHRTWVPDRLPKVGMGGTTDCYSSDIVPLPDDEDWHDDKPAEQARAVGLPEPPTDRIWLLRTPWPRIPVQVIYEIIWSVVERCDTRDEIAQMYRVATDVLTWGEDRALEACPADTRDLLDAWADAGRLGESAADLIEQRLYPVDVNDALSRTQLDEPSLLAWIAALGTDLGDDTIRFINTWRASALPGNPPPGASRYLERDPSELRTWLESGFDLHAASQLEVGGLATAIRWRDAGFTEADTYGLLRSDPALTPEEARAFDAGPARERRSEWIYYGFTGAQAAAWAGTGLTPAQARLWRACGKTADDVEPGQRFPPHLIEGPRHMGWSQSPDGEMSNSEWDEIPDPAWTRGRRARRWAGDDDAWMNAD